MRFHPTSMRVNPPRRRQSLAIIGNSAFLGCSLLVVLCEGKEHGHKSRRGSGSKHLLFGLPVGLYRLTAFLGPDVPVHLLQVARGQRDRCWLSKMPLQSDLACGFLIS